jgi:hypothetical protein
MGAVPRNSRGRMGLYAHGTIPNNCSPINRVKRVRSRRAPWPKIDCWQSLFIAIG